MSEMDPAEAQRRLAQEFESHGWEYDLTVGRSIVQAAERRTPSDPGDLANLVTPQFLERNATTREDVAAAIRDAIGDRVVGATDRQASITIDNQTYSLTVGTITGSNVNIGPGTQITVDASASRDNVLSAVATVVAAGLSGDWSSDAARELAAAVDARNDVTVQDIERATRDVAEAEQPDEGRIRDLMERIAVSGVGGALATGIVAALGSLL